MVLGLQRSQAKAKRQGCEAKALALSAPSPALLAAVWAGAGPWLSPQRTACGDFLEHRSA